MVPTNYNFSFEPIKQNMWLIENGQFNIVVKYVNFQNVFLLFKDNQTSSIFYTILQNCDPFLS
jgi:hypothetical protein